MERKKYRDVMFLFFVFYFFSLPVVAGNYAERIYEAYLTDNIPAWLSVMDEMEQMDTDDTGHWLELAGYYYGFTGSLITGGQNNEAKKYIKRGEVIVDRILKKEPDNPLALSYKGTFLAFKMALNKLKAVVLGPQSVKYINKAYSLDPEHYQIIADKANLLYYSPSLFGGNKEEALRLYKLSIQKMQTTHPASLNWFYLNLQSSLAAIYENQGEPEEAVRIYLHLVETEPRYIPKQNYSSYNPDQN